MATMHAEVRVLEGSEYQYRVEIKANHVDLKNGQGVFTPDQAREWLKNRGFVFLCNQDRYVDVWQANWD